MILPKRIERRERREFSHNSREKRVLGVDRLFRPLVGWKKHSKEPKRTLKKKELKRGQKSTQDPETVKEQFFRRGSFIFPSNQKREKQLLFLHESNKTCALCALFRRRRRRRESLERGLNSRRGRSSSRARGWVFCAREKERERDFALVVEKSSPFLKPRHHHHHHSRGKSSFY